MKKVICLFMSLLFVISCVISAVAADTDIAESGKTLVTYDDWVYERISGGRYWEIDSYIGQDTELAIPRIVNDVMVVSLSDYCFNGNTALKSIVTTSPLRNIGEYAFSGCMSLENVEVDFALQTIGVGAFSGTFALKNINLETSVVTEIKPHTFMNSGIENVKLPETCTKIDNYAFGQCYSLSRIEIPNSVTEIHEDAFKLSDNVVIYAASDSYAIEYAIANDIDYVITDEVEPTQPPTEAPTAAPTDPPTEEPTADGKTITYILGDADGDEIVNIIDATRVQRILAELYKDTDGMCSMRGDIDGDGLDIMDATRIQRHIAAYDDGYHIGEKVTKTLE